VHIGFRAPQAHKSCLSRILQPHATVSWGCTTGPTDIVPIRHNFWFRLPNWPPCVSQAPGPPGPQLAPSPIFHDPLLPLAGGFPQVPPISRSYSVIFGFMRQPPSPRESRASGPPASQPASISHLPTPYHHQRMRSATSYRCRAQAALLFLTFSLYGLLSVLI
jgi:hypothetical protein